MARRCPLALGPAPVMRCQPGLCRSRAPHRCQLADLVLDRGRRWRQLTDLVLNLGRRNSAIDAEGSPRRALPPARRLDLGRRRERRLQPAAWCSISAAAASTGASSLPWCSTSPPPLPRAPAPTLRPGDHAPAAPALVLDLGRRRDQRRPGGSAMVDPANEKHCCLGILALKKHPLSGSNVRPIPMMEPSGTRVPENFRFFDHV